MKVKIGNDWHDSTVEPICIQISAGEQQQIAELDRAVAIEGKYAVFPGGWGDADEMRKWMKDPVQSTPIR